LTFASAEHVLSQLEARGFITRTYALGRPRVAARTVELAGLVLPLRDAHRRIDAAEPPKHSRRADVIEQLMQKQGLPVETAARVAGGRSNLERLIRAGVVRYDRNGDSVRLVAPPLEAAEEVRRL